MKTPRPPSGHAHSDACARISPCDVHVLRVVSVVCASCFCGIFWLWLDLSAKEKWIVAETVKRLHSIHSRLCVCMQLMCGAHELEGVLVGARVSFDIRCGSS